MFHLSPNDAGPVNITKPLTSYSSSHRPATLKSRRIIRSLEEIEDEDGSGAIKSKVDTDNANDDKEIALFSGNYYERNSESMKFKMEEPSNEGDWEGGLIESSAEQDDDATDDVIQTQTHSVTAVKRMKMASVVNPSDIEEFESGSDDASSENVQEEEDMFSGSSSSGASDASALFSDEIQDESSDGSGKINKTILREVQRNLHKVWRYASSGKNLGMISKGPKGKEEEKKLQEIYNLVIKHESGRTEPKESVPGETASGLNMGDDLSDESGLSGQDDVYQMGSALFRDNEEETHVLSGDDSISGEGSGFGDLSEVSGDSASGSGEVNTKLLREVEHNLHKVWRYAAPKKDLDMVAKGPKGKEEEQKVKKIYNIVSKHETGSAFIDFELRKKEKSLSDSKQAPQQHHSHKSRKSRVKSTTAKYNATEEKLYRLQKARKYKYNKNLKSLKHWGMGMEKSPRKPGGKYVQKTDRDGKENGDKLAILGEEMKELAPSGKKADKTINKENSKEKLRVSKLDEENTATGSSVNDTASKELEQEHETSSAPDDTQSERIILDKQEPFDKTQLEVGKKIEELILNRMAQLESQGIQTKQKEKQEHFEESKEKDDQAETEDEPPKGKCEAFIDQPACVVFNAITKLDSRTDHAVGLSLRKFSRIA